MLKTSLVGAVLLALAACATTPPAPKTAAAKAPLGCVSDTATRLPVNPNDCAGFGSSYTKKDLDQTGRVYAQDALRDLDPAIR